jgi:hypothetical protein
MDGCVHPVDDGSHLGWQHVRVEVGSSHRMPLRGFRVGYLLCFASDLYQKGRNLSVRHGLGGDLWSWSLTMVVRGVASHGLFQHRNFALSLVGIFVEGVVYVT